MKKIGILGIAALLIVGILSTFAVSAYKGDYSIKGPDYTLERHELMENAFNNRDYDAWYELMSQNGRETKVMKVVTRENFEIFALAHEAGKSGDIETANILRAELGLNNGVGPKNGNGFQKNKVEMRNNFNGDFKENHYGSQGQRKGRI
jgi:hypothetical protein